MKSWTNCWSYILVRVSVVVCICQVFDWYKKSSDENKCYKSTRIFYYVYFVSKCERKQTFASSFWLMPHFTTTGVRHLQARTNQPKCHSCCFHHLFNETNIENVFTPYDSRSKCIFYYYIRIICMYVYTFWQSQKSLKIWSESTFFLLQAICFILIFNLIRLSLPFSLLSTLFFLYFHHSTILFPSIKYMTQTYTQMKHLLTERKIKT